MAFTSAGFPSELVRDVFVKAQGHSSLAKLSKQAPLSFSGTDIMTFSLDGEVNLVAEGAAKGQHTGGNSAVKMVPLKVEYGQRVSDEFIRCSDEKRLEYMRAFTDGFGKKISGQSVWIICSRTRIKCMPDGFPAYCVYPMVK